MAVAALALLLLGAITFRGSRRASREGELAREAEARRVSDERGYHETQREFTKIMQVTRDENEAYGLLKRHLQRSLAGSDVVVLNRNNSHDRLEAMTELPEGLTARREARDRRAGARSRRASAPRPFPRTPSSPRSSSVQLIGRSIWRRREDGTASRR